jgi:hypothetical protein
MTDEQPAAKFSLGSPSTVRRWGSNEARTPAATNFDIKQAATVRANKQLTEVRNYFRLSPQLRIAYLQMNYYFPTMIGIAVGRELDATVRV